MKIRLKRGTSDQISNYTGSSGELIFNTETGKLVAMDGATPGGLEQGGTDVIDINNPPEFQKVLPASSLLTYSANANQQERRGAGNTLAIQENQDTLYWVSGANASQDAVNNGATNAIYSVSKNDFNGWLQSASSSSGVAVPPISDLPSYQVISGLDWWTWMDNNGGRPTDVTKKYPSIFIDKQSTGANPVAYLNFWEEKRPGNSYMLGRVFIATGSNLENLQELLLPTINSQKSGYPALVDANAGGAFDDDQTAPTYNGYADMDPNFWSNTTVPTFVTANSTHIFVMVQWWGINVYLKDGTYVKSLKHPVLGWYNSGWGHAYLETTGTRPMAAMFCTDDRFVVVSVDKGKTHKYYQDIDVTYRDAAPGTLEAAKFDMMWGEIAVYTGDGTYINTIKNPMPRQTGEYNIFAYEAYASLNFLSNNILTVYNMDSQLIENGLGATNGIADGTTSFEEGAVHVYDLNTMTKINTVQNTDPDIVGWTWVFGYGHGPGPRAIPDGTNDCILILSSDDNKQQMHAVRGSTGEFLDTHSDVTGDPENDWFGWGNNYYAGEASIDLKGNLVQLDDGTIVLSGVANRMPPHATLFKLAGEIISKLRIGDNKFLKLPTDSSYELDITGIGRNNLSEFNNDLGFAIGTIPTALSELTNDAGLGKKNKEFRQWSTSSVDNPILNTSNIILPSQAKGFHYLTESPTSDFTVNITGEAAVVNGTPSLLASYTSVDDFISTGAGEINGTGNSSGRIVTACPAFALLWWDDNGDGTYKIGRITDGRGSLDSKYDSGYLGYDVSWNPAGTLTTGQTLAVSGSTEWKFPGGTPSNTVNIGAPLYLGSSWPGDMTAANKAGYYLRSVQFEVYTTDQNWQTNTTFNETLEIGESTKVEVMVDIGASAYKISSLEIDGVAQTVKWAWGTAPTGTANSRDVYSFEILKTADATYSIIGDYSSYS